MMGRGRFARKTLEELQPRQLPGLKLFGALETGAGLP